MEILEIIFLIDTFFGIAASGIAVFFFHTMVIYTVRWTRRLTDEDPLTAGINPVESEQESNFLDDENYQDF